MQLLSNIVSDPRVQALISALGPKAELHLVGGTVRDALLGRTESDLDFASRILPDELIAQLSNSRISAYYTGKKHQTVTVLPVEGLPTVEITTFRDANLTSSGGLSVSDSIEADLKYRDFTINAMAVCLNTFKLIDPHNGQLDLENKLLRAVSSPEERFQEDPLRIMRLVRFVCTFGFSIHPSTHEAARVCSDGIIRVSPERIRDEFSKILVSTRPDTGLRLLIELNILPHFLPEVCIFPGYEQNRFHKADLFEHTLEVICGTTDELELRLAALLHDVGKPATLSTDESGDRHFYRHEQVGSEMTEEILKRLKYPNEVVKNVSKLVQTHMRPLDAGAGGLRRLLRDTAAFYPLWRKLKEADARACKLDSETVSNKLQTFDKAMSAIMSAPSVSPITSLAISGVDVLHAGVTEGKEVGVLLRALHEKVLDNPSLNEKETLLGMLKEEMAQRRSNP